MADEVQQAQTIDTAAEVPSQPVDRPLFLSDLTKAMGIAEEQFEKRFAFKEHDHVKYPIKFDLSNLEKELRDHAISLTKDAKKYTDSLEEKLTQEIDKTDENASVELAVAWFGMIAIILGIIGVFVGLMLWSRPLAFTAAGFVLIFAALYFVYYFIGDKKK